MEVSMKSDWSYASLRSEKIQLISRVATFSAKCGSSKFSTRSPSSSRWYLGGYLQNNSQFSMPGSKTLIKVRLMSAQPSVQSPVWPNSKPEVGPHECASCPCKEWEGRSSASTSPLLRSFRKREVDDETGRPNSFGPSRKSCVIVCTK